MMTKNPVMKGLEKSSFGIDLYTVFQKSIIIVTRCVFLTKDSRRRRVEAKKGGNIR